MKKIGIIGGTFDPVHLGHVSLAEDARKQAGLDKVLFMPANIQPFKQDVRVTDGTHRLAMLDLALKGFSGLEVSTVEMELSGVSYTYRTLREVKKRLAAEDQLFFITGTDSFIKLDTWKHADELLSENRFIVGSRPGYKIAEMRMSKARYEKKYGTEVLIINNDRLDISSTNIKKHISNNRSIKELVAPEVGEYIDEHGLYR